MRWRGMSGAAVTAVVAAGAMAGVAALAGCSSLGSTTTTSADKPVGTTASAAATNTAKADGSSGDPGCSSALRAISEYGPSTVKLLAEGREAVTKAAVQMLVDGLDGAADVADSPRTKQAIRTLADAYDDYFDLTTDAVAIPLSTLLKDTAQLEFVCR